MSNEIKKILELEKEVKAQILVINDQAIKMKRLEGHLALAAGEIARLHVDPTFEPQELVLV